MMETEFAKFYCVLVNKVNFTYSETTSRVKEFQKISRSAWSLWLFR